MAKPSTKHITALNYGIQALESAKSNTVKNEQVRMLEQQIRALQHLRRIVSYAISNPEFAFENVLFEQNKNEYDGS